MTGAQLARVRWGVRGALSLGVATSVAANVLHADPNPISQAIAAWPPLALLLTVELISRVPVQQRRLAAVRLAATASIAGIAAWVSYWHMAGVAARYGEAGAAPYLIPLSVDGLVVVASVCLVELAGRLADLTRQPDTGPAIASEVPQPVADTTTDNASDTPPDRPVRPARKRSAATAVARMRTRHPDMPAREIARRLGVTDRTVRRHLSAAA
ncbi:DUF2637 domain-containing protein [Mangrovihabitans endophyticus]|uniref:Homeodomain-like domain-containing protein n=1 Tax=Mangrovihabitans endophyticus TaxID=1751298 RepID=A0A8J3FQQ5_9ACTN|nr:hypothetical protein GCM10012284_44750 [Mangrovihabitans endophyticus]